MSHNINPDWNGNLPCCSGDACPEFCDGECLVTNEDAEGVCQPAVVRMGEALAGVDRNLTYIRNLFGDEGVTRSVADRVKAAMPPNNKDTPR